MRFILLMSILLFKIVPVIAQRPVQTVKGIVTDRFSNAPIAAATVVLQTTPVAVTTTDTAGNFVFTQIATGRYNVQVSCVGYETMVLPEIVVTSSKEVVVNISLKENVATLKEVVVQPGVNKAKPLNAAALVSARMLSVEEAKRYAGGFDDPARLASAFAGVASNTGNNGIVIRGNAPQYLQWKMEGIEIPNPNHFADVIVFGGGGLTGLSSQMLANSDFLTGAFPAEYSNALSGVFDISMRTGNTDRHEHTFQLGITGIDLSSEGPAGRGRGSSYLFNYRYSTLALAAPVLPDNAGAVRYQDLAFKLHFPTKKAGIFSVWGIGLIDRSGAKAKTDIKKWEYDTDREESDIRQYMGAAGISHQYFFNRKMYWKTTLAATISGLDYTANTLDSQLVFSPRSRINNTNGNFVLSSFINKKFGSRHTNRTGLLITGMQYDFLIKDTAGAAQPLSTIVNQHGFSTLLSAYSRSTFNVTNRFVINAGINAQWFTLNNHYTIEPRLGIAWRAKNQTISIGYGLHSRLEKLNFYFTEPLAGNGHPVNKNLDFSKAHHMVAGYAINLSDKLQIKVEPYYQLLFNIPVMADSSFSFINLRNDWFIDRPLINTGKGKNYGVDVTVEKYLTHGYYWMVTTSVFSSKYRGGDQMWHNTRFNRNYLFNILAGKEWSTGKNKQKVWGLNGRIVFQGGDRYSPVNEAASLAARKVQQDEIHAFQQQSSPTLAIHFTASYKINKATTSQEWALKMINCTQQKDFFGYRYNYLLQTIDKDAEATFIPNISWRIEF